MSSPSSQSGPPGWYPDPYVQSRLRWWDGAAWSAATLDPASGEVAATATAPAPRAHVPPFARPRRRGPATTAAIVVGVVVGAIFVLGMVVAIAIPTFVGARARAYDRTAQTSLRNALTAAKTIYTDTETYSAVTPEALAEIEPSLQYVPAGAESTGPKVVSVAGSRDVWSAAVRSASGTCFWIKDAPAGAGITYGAGREADCTGTAVGHAGDARWGDS